jgi:hypothetical protein
MRVSITLPLEREFEGGIRAQVAAGIPEREKRPAVDLVFQGGHGGVANRLFVGRKPDSEFFALALGRAEEPRSKLRFSLQPGGIGKVLDNVRGGPFIAELPSDLRPLGKGFACRTAGPECPSSS